MSAVPFRSLHPPPLLQLNANDSVFEYRFEDPTSLPKFSIDPSTGDITLLMTVDYEAGETDFVFTVCLTHSF